MRNHELEQAVARGAGELAKKRDETQKRRMKQAELEAYDAAKGSRAGEGGDGLELRVAGGALTIGDVSAPIREAGQPELVPNPAFVPISAHVALLRELLIDWTLGQHLLLLGEQGVGKNKLADKLRASAAHFNHEGTSASASAPASFSRGPKHSINKEYSICPPQPFSPPRRQFRCSQLSASTYSSTATPPSRRSLCVPFSKMARSCGKIPRSCAPRASGACSLSTRQTRCALWSVGLFQPCPLAAGHRQLNTSPVLRERHPSCRRGSSKAWYVAPPRYGTWLLQGVPRDVHASRPTAPRPPTVCLSAALLPQAPLEVVCVLKALAEEGQLTLGDGRRLQASAPSPTAAGSALVGAQSDEARPALEGEVVPVASEFRMIVLANPPGWPFQGGASPPAHSSRSRSSPPSRMALVPLLRNRPLPSRASPTRAAPLPKLTRVQGRDTFPGLAVRPSPPANQATTSSVSAATSSPRTP